MLWYSPGANYLVVLRCGKCVMSYRRGDCLNPGKCVGNDVVLAGYVSDIRREMGDEVQMVKVAQ